MAMHMVNNPTRQQQNLLHYIGDSNTVRMHRYGIISDGTRLFAMSGIGVEDVTRLPCIERQDKRNLTIVEAMRYAKPQKAVIMLGTNDVAVMQCEQYLRYYQEALDALQTASPQSTLAINSIPPIAHGSWLGDDTSECIKQFNAGLEKLCEQRNIKFLNSFAQISAGDGFCLPGYTEPDGFHLNGKALQAIVTYCEQNF